MFFAPKFNDFGCDVARAVSRPLRGAGVCMASAPVRPTSVNMWPAN